MPVRHQRDGNLIDRVRHQTELRALEQARRVTWRRLAAVADEYTEWQVFGLWVRAVVEATGGIPAMVAHEMESRTPLLLAGIGPDLDAAVRNGSGFGARIWEDVTLWAEMSFFHRREASRLVGCCPVLFFGVAALDPCLVTLGEGRQGMARHCGGAGA